MKIHKLTVYVGDYCVEYEIGKPRIICSETTGEHISVVPNRIVTYPDSPGAVEVLFENGAGSMTFAGLPYTVLKVRNE